MAKVFEKTILLRLNAIKDFTGQNQHGFKKNHSTVTALLDLQHEIATSIDDNFYHGVVSLDLSAAFDMVNPDLLVERLKISGVPNDISEIIRDWLSERKAYVEIGGETSYMFEVPEGTVQGSVLGPVLFAIFIAPMFDLVNANSYADDSYLSEKGENVEDLTEKLSNSATILTNWFKDSGLVVNETKTEFCVFHKNKTINCTIRINNIEITNKPSMKALGLTLDAHLNWEDHILKQSKQCDKITMGFNLLKKHFNRDELLTLVTSLFYSKLYYASEVWLSSNLSMRSQKLLLTTSSRVLKTISGIKCNHEDKISYYELHKRLNRATPQMMTLYVQATCLHRVLTNNVPNNVFLDLLYHHYEARRHYKPTFSKTNKTRVGCNIFRNRIQKSTNQLSTDLTVLSYNQLKVIAKRDFLKFPT